MKDLKPHTLRSLISEDEISKRVKALGAKIAEDYKGKQLLVVGVLKGSVVFLADLIRAIPTPVEIAFISVSSYDKGVESSGAVRLVCDLDRDIIGMSVLIVEDIVDSGSTMKFLIDTLSVRQPESVKVCTMLDKPSRRVTDVNIDYKGFEVEDAFAVGYGLDYAGCYRNLPYVAMVDFDDAPTE